MDCRLTCSVLLVAALSACSSDSSAPPPDAAGAAGANSTAGTTSSAGTNSEAGTTSSAGDTSIAGASGGSAGSPTSGSAGTAGNPAAGASGGGTTDPTKPAPKPSSGCGKAADQALGMYVQKTLAGTTRTYKTFLPMGYSPTRAYPLVLLGHGCGGNGNTPFPLETASKTDAIVIAMKSAGSCFEYSPTGPDVTYFDKLLAEVSADRCVDTGRVFVAGFSSGSWLSNTLGCVRAGVLRGQGNASGNEVDLKNCKGPIAAMFAHDLKDNTNSYAGGEIARDRILKQNGCSMTETDPYDYDGDPSTPSTCMKYRNCMPGFPVVWCPTTAGPGKATHNPQVPISTVGFWRFWSNL